MILHGFVVMDTRGHWRPIWVQVTTSCEPVDFAEASKFLVTVCSPSNTKVQYSGTLIRDIWRSVEHQERSHGCSISHKTMYEAENS
jgi:hypothetical protein